MINRRQLLTTLAGTGIGTAVFHRAVVGLLQDQEEPAGDFEITAELIQQAEWISGIKLEEKERQSLAATLGMTREPLRELRKRRVAFDCLPAVHFQPLSGVPKSSVSILRSVFPICEEAITLPSSEEEIAFSPVTKLAALLRQRKLSSVELTKLYLRRLKKYNPLLNCVVNLTEELALEQASRADAEIAAGKYRGPLHGIPWGAKDLVAVPNYPTTWGIPQFKERILKETATVATRLEEAGAVLIAKLSLGAIAMGDRWFGDFTRNPWNYRKGSSGSSAGSASATAAGLVGFSIGSETLGSILSPSMTCGVTGFRPTFGRVSRHGCMSLAWTMDKIGPITRCVEDSALVFAAIHGADGKDPTVHDWPFEWPAQIDIRSLRVGYEVPWEEDAAGDAEQKLEEYLQENEALRIFHELGCQLVPFQWPKSLQGDWVLMEAINVEGAVAFDEMLQSGDTEGWNEWPEYFESAHFLTAVDYLRMMRRRRQLQFLFEEFMEPFDLILDADDWLVANVTGHPAITLPIGFEGKGRRRLPGSVRLTGHLNADAKLLAAAKALQSKISSHLEHPPLEQQLTRKKEADAKKAERKKKAEAENKK